MNASTITYLLDRDCKMRFESSEQMSNHAKKVFIIFIYIQFCINSSYGNIQKLDEKYNADPKSTNQVNKPSFSGKDPSNLRNYGAFTLVVKNIF